jgi:hypothetical protein
MSFQATAQSPPALDAPLAVLARLEQDAEKHLEMIWPPMNADKRRLKTNSLSAFIGGPFAFFSSPLERRR